MATPVKSPKATGWVLGTVFVALLLSAGAWFLAISPLLDRAAEANEQAAGIEASNELLQVRIDRLKEQFADLDDYKAELAGLRAQIPTDAQLAAYLREVSTIAEASTVTITAVGASNPQVVVLPVPVAAATPPESPEATGGMTPETPAESPAPTDGVVPEPPAPAGPVAPEGFVSIPITVTAVGTYDNILIFVNQLQNSTQRLFLITSFVGTGQQDVEESGGRPATAVGDLEVAISGFAYVLQEPAATAVPVTVDPAAPPATLPPAVPGKNPLVPAGG